MFKRNITDKTGLEPSKLYNLVQVQAIAEEDTIIRKAVGLDRVGVTLGRPMVRQCSRSMP